MDDEIAQSGAIRCQAGVAAACCGFGRVFECHYGGEVIVDRFYKSVAPLDVSTFSS